MLLNRLTAVCGSSRCAKPGFDPDGGGLYLQVTQALRGCGEQKLAVPLRHPDAVSPASATSVGWDWGRSEC